MKKKKILKIIFFIAISLLFIFSCYNIYSFFTKGKQEITVKTSSNYYVGSDISGVISVKELKNNKSIESKLEVALYDENDKKIKNVSEKYELNKGEDASFSLKLPKELKTGSYTLKVVSKAGFLKDTAEIPISIINDVKSNVVISLDKGIYKPGDEVLFRALILSQRDNTPVKNDVSIYIYDGNGNKVYSNNTQTSEYGIVSGNFKLADEVNSGNYKLTIATETQEISKTFTVNPYITPKFETFITTDKENYLVGETAQITVSGKYFFGEPVKGSEVEGTIDGKKVVGFTDEEGKFTTSYKFDEAKKIDVSFNVIDTSKYIIENKKTIVCGTNIFEIEALPEYGQIATGVDNDIYIITKDINGNPVKTYSTINIDNISKQVISDENGFGKLTLTSSEIDSLKLKFPEINMKITSEDMSKNKVTSDVYCNINSDYNTLIKTDKVKYNVGDDIKISLNSSIDINSNTIYVLKNNELLKTISTQEDEVKINLEDISGLVDIVIPNEKISNRKNYSYSSFSSKYFKNYSKKTIFIKPNKELNIGILTDKEQYKPGDTLNVSFTTTNEKNENVEAALLVSILDEAILNLAENDLSIDNIKMALEDIELSEGMTAADLYAIILDDSSEHTLNTILLKQDYKSPNIINKTYRNYDTEIYLVKGVGIAIVYAILLGIYFATKYEKVRKFISKLIVPVINVLFIFIIMMIYLSDFIDDYIYSGSAFIIILTNFILSIILYVLVLYKQKEFMYKMIMEIFLLPLVIVISVYFVSELIYEIFIDMPYYEYSEIFKLVVILGYLLIYTILTVLKRKKELKGFLKFLHNLGTTILKAGIFWILAGIAISLMDAIGFIIVFIGYIFVRKIIFKETNTKLKDGKIILNINPSEILGILMGIGMVGLVLIILMLSSVRKFAGSIDYVGTAKQENVFEYDMETSDSINPSLDMDPTYIVAADSSSASSSINGSSVINSMYDTFFDSEESIKSDVENAQVEIQKDIEIEENVRNVFLESLAFVPEIITSNGKGDFTTEISDNITTWNIQTVGNTKDGNIGYGETTFKVFKEFFVDFSLPTNSVVTDRTNIPVTLYNYTENELSINLNVKENDWSKIGEYTKVITVPANSTNMIYIPLEIIKDGNNVLRVEAISGEVSDIVEKTMSVKPNGLEKNAVVSSGIIQNDYSQDIIFNEEAVEGTKKLKVKLYASPIAQNIENIEGMLKMPTGCFEQTSSSLYPDILVLKYLRENNMNNPELEEKALDYISKGYQKLLTYEVQGTEGGYSLYGDSPAEPVITAFGLMEMKELSEVYQIDENVIEEMKEYLFDEQNVNGSFNYNSTYIGGSGSTDDLAMNAYIIWALSEVCPDDERLKKSIEYLEDKYENNNEIDNYTLALMANVFANINDKTTANKIIKLLKEDIQVSNEGAYIGSKIRDYYGTRGKYQNIQTTALTSIALTKLNSDQKNNSEFIKYLVSSKKHNGTWGTTQSTILALKAINAYSENSDLKNQTIIVRLNNEEKKVDIKENALDIYEFEFENVSDENNISIDMEKGKLIYEISKNYYLGYDKLEKTDGILISQNINTNVNVNDIITQRITVKNNSEYIENGLLEINIPQGCTPIEDSLLKLKYEGKIEKYEYNYGKINIYIRDFDKEEFTAEIQYRALYPENITGAAIRFYDYYNPELEEVAEPVNIIVN